MRVLKIPSSRISRLVIKKKRTMFVGWNKESSPRHGQYKQYKIGSDQGGNYFVKYYLSLQITGEEEGEILFPPYEIDTLQRLTGRFAE